MKRSFFIRMIALAGSVALLAGAMVVAAVTGSPYEILKKSVLDLGSLSSHSTRYSVGLTYDGVELTGENGYTEYVEGKYSMSQSEYHTSYSTSTGQISLYNDEINGTTGNFYTYGNNDHYIRSTFNSLDFFSNEDPRYVRLYEMALDLIVGDLKNNISMTQTGDMRHISATFTANQIPELYSTAFDLLMAENGGSYFNISDGYDLTTFDPQNMTIERCNNYISNATVYENIYLCELRELDENNNRNYYDDEILEKVKNGEGHWGIVYIDGVYYEEWNTHYNGNYSERPLDEATFLAYAGEDDLPPIATARIDYAHGEADVDTNGVIRRLAGNASISFTDIFGKDHEIEIVLEAEVNDISGTANARLEKILSIVAAYAPERDQYYSISFKLDENDNPIVTDIYDGWSSDYSFDSGVGFDVETEAYPADDEMELWVAGRVDEMLDDPLYAGIESDILEALAINEWIAAYGDAV